MNRCAPTFVVSTGRCATTLLGLFLNADDSSLALNEGQLRDVHSQGPQILPALTLENRLAYEQPALAADILREKRLPQIRELIEQKALTHFVEIAYYYSPFVAALRTIFPESKLLFIHRDGRDFVRSAYVDEVPDPMPVGYLDPRPLHPVERYVAMGRLAPTPEAPDAARWEHFSPFEKNVWLWAETNRIIRDGLTTWPSDAVLTMPMHRMVTPEGLVEIADFLDMDRSLSQASTLLETKVNARKSRVLPHWTQWDETLRTQFKALGQDMLQTLGYATDAPWTVSR
ncbi:hypothetical protein GO013_14585 [Pseudodesulfovibrio sp. JC047]|uniref:sulfotransferase n=1 Tax=Pseudodesulfovibrio sp. JC047 TaxID=2683199 RepID=UPI0013D73C39|nr:sulfotransferase [Pseudodesulfovibrio sp. JC047]NDV20635.1 hypothetical protein [Pseudodesulfovibrio sp. JC047]